MKKLLLPLLALLGCTYADAQRIKGSDTVLPLTQALSEMYMNEHPSASVTVTGGGSGVGISALMEGTTDLAMASRRIKFSEKMKMKQAKHQPEEVVVAYDGGKKFVTPSIESAIRKEYPVVRPLYYYYDKANEKAVQPFLEYLDTPQAREKTLDLGFIPR